MTDTDRTADPRTDQFKYTLQVDDHHDTDNGICHYPRYGWACLARFNPDEPTSDANPYPAVYIQEQTFTMDDYVETPDTLEHSAFPIAGHEVMYPHQINDFTGWEDGPSRLFDFIETVRDEYYEHGVDPTTLPVRVITYRTEVSNPDADKYDEYCEVYLRNGQNNVEYLMWNTDELYGPADNSVGYVADSELIQKVLAAMARAYEEPDAFLRTWQDRSVDP